MSSVSYIASNHSKFKIIPHSQQSINRTMGLVNVRHAFQGKTVINKPEQLIESRNFSSGFGVTKFPLYLEKDNVSSHPTLKL